MAADTGGFMGDILFSTTERKISRTSAGHLVGCAGSLPDTIRFHAWAEEGFLPETRPEDFGDFGALVVDKTGAITKYDGRCRPYPCYGPFGIEGCAEEFLMGALASGCTAKEAIVLAIKCVVWAAGDVQVEKLKKARK